MKRLLFLFLIACMSLYAQTPVALSPSVHPQFLDANGKVLAGGFIYTYQAGTSIRQDTYTDSTGVIINAWPIPLDATGAPSNGSTETGIWLANQSYKICAYNSALVQQWCTDNVSAYQILNGVQNIVFGSVTSDPSGSAGEIGYRSDLGCFRGYSTFWDCFVTDTGIQTLTNKTLTAPIITNAPSPSFISPSITGLTIGGVSVATGNPTNFANFTNGAAGTTLNQLAKLVASGAGSTAVSTAITDTSGVVGVVIAGAGTSGLDLIQSAGQVLCIFDGGTTVEDYVQISSSIAGNCHDTGSTSYPAGSVQVIGRVLTTNAGAGTYLVDLFPPEIHAGGSASIICTNFTPVTVTNNNTLQNLMSCTIPANALAQGSLLNIDLQGVESNASAGSTIYSISLGGGTPCQTESAQGGANNQPWNIIAKFFVLTSGAGGTANWSCEYFSSASGGGVLGPFGVVGAPTISINTAISNTLLITEQMTVANAGNSVTQQGLKAVIF